MATLPRRGLTLVELLVVIVLLLIVTAVAIPVLSPNSESRRIRESARLVSTFLSGARNRAIELGRPVGVQFERLASNPNAAMVLSYVEVPPPYSGETLDATCAVFFDSSSGKLFARMPSTSFSPNLIQLGDLIKINYQGYTYVLDAAPVAVGSNYDLELDVIASNNPPLPWQTVDLSANANAPDGLPKYPYQITRQPVKASDPPLQLPEGAVVDLMLSGEGSWIIEPDQATQTPPKNPAIIFGPNGAVVSRFNFQDPNNTAIPHYQTPVSALHFMIGRSDGVSTTFDENVDFPDRARTPWNLRDLNNLWVSVGSQSGLVSTAENARVTDSTFTISGTTTPFDVSLYEARSIARSFQSMGGR